MDDPVELGPECTVLDVREDTGMDPFVGRDVLIAQIRRVVGDAKTVRPQLEELAKTGKFGARIVVLDPDGVEIAPGTGRKASELP